jgi:hypothetical protein
VPFRGRATAPGPEEEAALLAKVRSRLPWHFELSVVYLAEIPRGPSGKYEDFYSELAS